MHEDSRRTCVLAVALAIGAATEAIAQPAGTRIAVFRAAGFPTVDAPEIAAGTLDQALAGSNASAYASVSLRHE